MTPVHGPHSIRTHHKDDNASPESKLALRRHFLRKYHEARSDERPVYVLDCCQAEAILWSQLRSEFDVIYWGVDRTAKRGRLAIDSVRLLAQPNLPYDVIDVDTYGSPWQHWKTMLPNIRRPTSVFLTLGRAGGLTSVDSAVLEALGLARMRQLIPNALRWKLDGLAVGACLAQAYAWGLKISEAVEVQPAAHNARYFGLHLHP